MKIITARQAQRIKTLESPTSTCHNRHYHWTVAPHFQWNMKDKIKEMSVVDDIRFRSRHTYSGSDILCDLKVENLHFRTFCRMSYSDFDTLINLVGPRISKKDTSFRKAIPVAERLAVTLRFLASGDSFTSLSLLFQMSKQSSSTIIHFLFNF